MRAGSPRPCSVLSALTCAALCLGPLVAPPALAAEMVALPVGVANVSGAAVTCHAEIAHWFAADLGRVAPGAELALDLWRDPASGMIATRNAGGEFLPVERAWCGLEGRAWETRWEVPLTRAAGTAPQPVQGYACTLAQGRLSCS